ncbi:MAG TPA: carboxypeptidase regulatory-like domain-containing protein, partial [Longimicrobiaceae bacterium]|nr:carboxypeptidase regulatory-like domain-containing protein [Longimicrobiaceae bacterium]
MPRPHALLSLPLLLALAAVPAAAQSIRGRVLDAASSQPVPEATVIALSPLGDTATARTDSAGAFLLALRDAGSYRLRAERVGYQAGTAGTVRVFSHETVEVDLRLSTAAVRMEPLVVRTRFEERVRRLEMNGFYERREQGAGRFVTRREIEQQHPVEISDVLRRQPGVGAIPNRHGRGVQVVLTRGATPCAPEVFLDGMILGRAGTVPLDEVID